MDFVDGLLRGLGTIGLIAMVPLLYRGRVALRRTTLTSAWGWLVAGLLLWAIAWGATVLTSALEDGFADQLWYGVAVLMLCPPIAVLGARRPGSRVWAWFVLVPLVLVLGLPALTAWTGDFEVAPLQVDVPVLIGYALVMVMGAGNYFGTRFTTSSVLYAAALILLAAPFSPAVPPLLAEAERSRVWATLCLSAAGGAVIRQATRPVVRQQPFDRLWIDFRDFFGIVWARRILDRVNNTARKEGWPLRLEMHGLVRVGNDVPPGTEAGTTERLDHTFRWLLRRFVDPEWIDERLQSPRGGGNPGDAD